MGTNFFRKRDLTVLYCLALGHCLGCQSNMTRATSAQVTTKPAREAALEPPASGVNLSARLILWEAECEADRLNPDIDAFRAQSLAEIAIAKARLGDPAAAVDTLAKSGQRGSEFSSSLEEIGRWAVIDGDEAAEATIGRIRRVCGPECDEIDAILLQMIVSKCRGGDLNDAKQLLARLKNVQPRAQAEAAIAARYWAEHDAQAAEKTFAHAIAIARQCEGEIAQALACLKVVDRRREIGDVSGALAELDTLAPSFRKFSDVHWRCVVLSEAAVEYALAGNHTNAIALITEADDALKGAELDVSYHKALLARAQARAGDTAGAIARLKSLPCGRQVEEAARDIAMMELAAGRDANALEIAASIILPYRFSKDSFDRVLLAIISQRCRAHRLEAAAELCSYLSNRTNKAQGLLIVATAQLRDHDPMHARATAQSTSFLIPRRLTIGQFSFFDCYQPATWTVDYDSDGTFQIDKFLDAQRRIADLAAAAMDFYIAVNRAPIDNALYFQTAGPEALRQMAASETRAGYKDAALALARSAPRPEDRINALLGVAEAMEDPPNQVDEAAFPVGERMVKKVQD
jgi:hypothetical protein